MPFLQLYVREIFASPGTELNDRPTAIRETIYDDSRPYRRCCCWPLLNCMLLLVTRDAIVESWIMR